MGQSTNLNVKLFGWVSLERKVASLFDLAHVLRKVLGIVEKPFQLIARQVRLQFCRQQHTNVPADSFQTLQAVVAVVVGDQRSIFNNQRKTSKMGNVLIGKKATLVPKKGSKVDLLHQQLIRFARFGAALRLGIRFGFKYSKEFTKKKIQTINAKKTGKTKTNRKRILWMTIISRMTSSTSALL